MSRLEFLRYVTIGQYLARDSIIHRLDPRFKLLAFGLIVVAITFSNTYLANALLVLTVTLLLILSKLPLGHTLRGLRPALPALALLALFQMLFPPQTFGPTRNCTVIWRWGFVELTSCTLQLIVVSTARLVELFVLTSLLTFSTTTTELVHGTEGVLAPLQQIGFPAHELTLVVTIALRFVPTLALQMERLVKAQIARGADFGTSGRFRFIKATRRLLPLLIPLFLISLRRSEALIVAMEARGYTGGRGRTRRRRLRAGLPDYVALVAAAAFCVATLWVDAASMDRALIAWLQAFIASLK
jgi:energy-coupling factor transport system permease protein